MAISFANLNNSGYDFAAITQQLAEFEKQSIIPYQTRVTTTTTKISGMGSLRNAIDGLRTATEKLATALGTAPAKASVTGDGVTATATAGAVAGSYTIIVDKLAVAGSLKSSAFDSRTAENGTGGTIAIKTVGGAPIDIVLGTDTSLNGVRDAINAKTDSPVNATIVTDGEGKSTLLMTSRTTGEKAEVESVTVTGNDVLAGELDYTKGGTVGKVTIANQAVDAEFTLNGVAIKTGSNNPTSIDNLTLNLTAITAPGKSVTVKVESDVESQVTAIQNFVTAYNAMRTTTKSLSDYNKDGAATSLNGSLYADNTLRGAQDAFASTIRVANDSENIFSLAKLGIITDVNAKNGTLSIDVAKVREAVTKYPSEVSKLLAGEGGLSSQITEGTKQYLDQGSVKGKISAVEANLNDQLKKQQKAVEDVTTRVEQTNAMTIAQFNALTVALSKIESTKSYLTSQFEAMANSNKK